MKTFFVFTISLRHKLVVQLRNAPYGFESIPESAIFLDDAGQVTVGLDFAKHLFCLSRNYSNTSIRLIKTELKR